MSGGDMRKVLNVLECVSLAHDKIAEEDVYSCTGKPSPKDVNIIMKSLLKDSMKDAVATFMEIKDSKSLTLDDLVKELHKAVMSEALSKKRKMYLVIQLAEIDNRISIGCNEKIQVKSIVGAFIFSRQF